MQKFAMNLRWVLACVALHASGCGKTEQDHDVEDDILDAPASKPLADLSDDEAAEICKDISSFVEGHLSEHLRGACIVYAAQESASVSECDAAADTCLADVEPPESSVAECVAQLRFKDCEAKVSDLEHCLADQRDGLERIAEVHSCADVFDDREAASELLAEPASCKHLAQKCPSPFGGEPDPGDAPEQPESGAPRIEGSIAGKEVAIHSDGNHSHGTSTLNEEWASSLHFAGASLWIWGDANTAQGLLRMPASGPEASNWLCLEEVQAEWDQDSPSWKSEKLSVLPECDGGDRGPLELSFAVGYSVSGTLHGEPVAWVSNGFSCSDSSCDLYFGEGDVLTGQTTWTLEVTTPLEQGVSNHFESATLIHTGNRAAVACGSSGFVSWSEDDTFEVVVDGLGALNACPGTPLEGELGGSL